MFTSFNISSTSYRLHEFKVGNSVNISVSTSGSTVCLNNSETCNSFLDLGEYTLTTVCVQIKLFPQSKKVSVYVLKIVSSLTGAFYTIIFYFFFVTQTFTTYIRFLMKLLFLYHFGKNV